MAGSAMEVAHSLPGRLRLRMHDLKRDPWVAQDLLEGAAQLAGVHEARARPSTGSLLLHYDPDQTGEEELTEALGVLLGKVVARHFDRPRAEEGRVEREVTSLAHATARFFRELNRDIERATDGRVDLGILLTAGFMVAGALEVVRSRDLPAPPWFNLAWWGFRTFMTLEQEKLGHGGAQP